MIPGTVARKTLEPAKYCVGLLCLRSIESWLDQAQAGHQKVLPLAVGQTRRKASLIRRMEGLVIKIA